MSNTGKSVLLELVAETLNKEKRHLTVEDIEYFLEAADTENHLVSQLQEYWQLVVQQYQLRQQLKN